MQGLTTCITVLPTKLNDLGHRHSLLSYRQNGRNQSRDCCFTHRVWQPVSLFYRPNLLIKAIDIYYCITDWEGGINRGIGCLTHRAWLHVSLFYQPRITRYCFTDRKRKSSNFHIFSAEVSILRSDEKSQKFFYRISEPTNHTGL